MVCGNIESRYAAERARFECHVVVRRYVRHSGRRDYVSTVRRDNIRLLTKPKAFAMSHSRPRRCASSLCVVRVNEAAPTSRSSSAAMRDPKAVIQL